MEFERRSNRGEIYSPKISNVKGDRDIFAAHRVWNCLRRQRANGLLGIERQMIV